MDDRRFDTISRKLASGVSRRAVVRGLLGFGGVAVAAGFELHHADAARRGFSGPPILGALLPEPTTQCSSDYDCGGDIVCCVGTCCTAGQSCITTPNNNSYCE